VNVREATAADKEMLLELWRAFEAEVPDLEVLTESPDEAWADLSQHIENGVALVAEEEGKPIGFAFAGIGRIHPGIAHLTDLYVVPEARSAGIGTRLVEEVESRLRERGISHLSLHVLVSNPRARDLYKRLGFADHELLMIKSLEARPQEPSSGTLFVQTDDETAVERTVAKIVPRLGRSPGTHVSPPRNGWIEVDDELCRGDPALLRRLGSEISYALGAVALTLGIEQGAVVRYILFDRGGIADEYASVPEYFGPLPPGDVVALAANPTVANRLAGADPARMRAVARTAASPDELPPPAELLAQLAEVLGVSSDQ
jgi:ribosomal protein S18 acetylase RimI-like enzyme